MNLIINTNSIVNNIRNEESYDKENNNPRSIDIITASVEGFQRGITSTELRLPTFELSPGKIGSLKASVENILDNLDNLTPDVMEMLRALMEAFNEGNTALASFNSKFAIISRNLMRSVADSIEKQGMVQMTGAIAGGATSFATSTLAASASSRGIGKQVGAASASDEAKRSSMTVDAQRLMSKSHLLHATGASLSGVTQGVTTNFSHIAAAEQKMEEQSANVAVSVKENASQEVDKIKDLKEFILNIIRGIVDAEQQARDAAAMGCRI
ncbi:TPA: hypothetical protein PXM37_004212 [Yersinia enterocolitica]|nr:hypothetical protein [Yersinia enterocolitica]HDL6985265.1 hypothetical protein [Yersinia enterocolitica]HDL7067807.1 hypothetical protein [Yersinia enterocolitica]HDL7072196.1 hypothetical protein [Yersinia enterocolitica]